MSETSSQPVPEQHGQVDDGCSCNSTTALTADHAPDCSLRICRRCRMELPDHLPGDDLCRPCTRPHVDEALDEDRLGDLLAVHAFSHVNADGWTVCLCGAVQDDDDDDGSHGRHQARVVLAVQSGDAQDQDGAR